MFTTSAITSPCTVSVTFIQVNADGDFDANGVSASDALHALRIAAGLISFTADELAHGDVAPMVNRNPQPDGKIGIDDVVVILRKVVGLLEW
jgi:hypothetical protein